MPASLTPRRFVRHDEPYGAECERDAPARFVPKRRHILITEPANATAMTGSDAQIEIQ